MTKHHAPKPPASRPVGPEVDAMFGPQSRHVQQAQEDLMTEAGSFWTAWLQRRQDAMQQGIEAASLIAQLGTRDPAGALKVMTDWQISEMARLGLDASDTTAMMTRCVGDMMTREVEAAEELAEATKAATSTHYALPL